jgi:hypothetical protein
LIGKKIKSYDKTLYDTKKWYRLVVFALRTTPGFYATNPVTPGFLYDPKKSSEFQNWWGVAQRSSGSGFHDPGSIPALVCWNSV